MTKLNFQSALKNTFLLLGLVLFTASTLPSKQTAHSAPYTLADIQVIYPEARSYKSASDKSIVVTAKKGKILGYLLASADFGVKYKGYAGSVPVLIAFNEARSITGVYLLKNNEEDEFMDKVKDGRLLTRWNSKQLNSFLPNENVDAVSGATYSSTAIINTVRHTIAAYLKTEAPAALPVTKKQSTEKPIANTTQPAQGLKEKKSVGPRPYIMPKPALVIGSYSAKGVPDIMTAAWVGIANSNPLCIAVSIRPTRLTYENIKATGYFTVNVPSAKYAAHMDYAGSVSGRQEDKFKVLGLTPVKGQFANAPYVGEFPIVIECQVIDTINLGSHTQFIGKVLDTKVDADLLDANNRVYTEKLQPIAFDESGYYMLGKRLGKPFDMYKTVNSNEKSPESDQNSTLETIFSRKSVRRYTNQQVSREQLTLLAKAGMAAPSAVDKRPWVFVAVTDRAMLDKLADVLPYAKMLRQATAAIMVGGDMNKTLGGDAKAFWIQDCSAATQNILLAAESIGLGAVWTGVHPNAEREKAVANVLQLPENIVPLNVIVIGYPTGVEKPKDKWNEQLLHWEKW